MGTSETLCTFTTGTIRNGLREKTHHLNFVKTKQQKVLCFLFFSLSVVSLGALQRNDDSSGYYIIKYSVVSRTRFYCTNS